MTDVSLSVWAFAASVLLNWILLVSTVISYWKLRKAHTQLDQISTLGRNIDRTDLALEVARIEGKSRSVNIAQIREVQGTILSLLARERPGSVLELLDKVRREDKVLAGGST